MSRLRLLLLKNSTLCAEWPRTSGAVPGLGAFALHARRYAFSTALRHNDPTGSLIRTASPPQARRKALANLAVCRGVLSRMMTSLPDLWHDSCKYCTNASVPDFSCARNDPRKLHTLLLVSLASFFLCVWCDRTHPACSPCYAVTHCLSSRRRSDVPCRAGRALDRLQGQEAGLTQMTVGKRRRKKIRGEARGFVGHIRYVCRERARNKGRENVLEEVEDRYGGQDGKACNDESHPGFEDVRTHAAFCH